MDKDLPTQPLRFLPTSGSAFWVLDPIRLIRRPGLLGGGGGWKE